MSQPLRVGIIGTGWGINVHLPVFRAAGMQVTAVYSRSMDKARKIADRHKLQHAFDSVEALCRCADVDLVTVTSPTYLHAEHAEVVLRSGKHLLCDKPVAVGARSAARLAAVPAPAGKIAVVDHELRFLDSVRAAREAVQSGQIGDVRHVNAVFHADMKGLGQTFGWWHERSKGGGITGAVGVHVIDCLHYILGRKVARLTAAEGIFAPTRAAARGSAEKKAVTAEDMFTFIGELQGGGLVTVSVSGCHPGPPERVFTFVGSSGSVRLDLVVPSAIVKNAKGKKVSEVKDPKTAPDAFIIGTAKLAAALQKAAAGDSAALSGASTLRDGVYTQAVVDAVHSSADSGGSPQLVQEPAAKL
eukprot:TRINITY_DN30666_c0_g1_i1.p2 TRINITY_DN30666_c0_g1~~TRINITY_DN30666_c0_g1_i1.p2  ORF type:complete len:359 (+),score=134.15 TRINITY_DN30666_c0_g1_i1:77-1153(+)